MTIKEQLLLTIDTLPEELLPQALQSIEAIAKSTQTADNPDRPPAKTGESLAEYFSKPENQWAGDDLQECLEIVVNSRSPLVYEFPNPFDINEPNDHDGE